MKRRFFSIVTAVALLGTAFGGFIAASATPAAADFNPNEGYLDACLDLTPEGFESCLEAIVLIVNETLEFVFDPGVAGPNIDLQEIIHNAVDPVLESLQNLFNIPSLATPSVAAPQQAPLVPDVVGTIGNTLSNLTDTVSNAAALPVLAPAKVLQNLPNSPVGKILKLQNVNDSAASSESPFSSADLAGMAAIAGLAMIGGTSAIRRRSVAKAKA